jgi:transposase-like protein
MTKPDARYLNPTIQDYLRQQAIRLREQGKRVSEMATYLGVQRTTVSDWWRQYQQVGEAALHPLPQHLSNEQSKKTLSLHGVMNQDYAQLRQLGEATHERTNP